MAARKGQQRAAPRQRQGRAQRKLVRGRDADHTRAGGQLVYLHALVVHRHWHQPGPGRGKGMAQRRIAGVFHSHYGLARRDQHARDQVEGLLRAGGHDHVVGAAGYRARERDVAGNRFAQLDAPHDIGVALRAFLLGLSVEGRCGAQN